MTRVDNGRPLPCELRRALGRSDIDIDTNINLPVTILVALKLNIVGAVQSPFRSPRWPASNPDL